MPKKSQIFLNYIISWGQLLLPLPASSAEADLEGGVRPPPPPLKFAKHMLYNVN